MEILNATKMQAAYAMGMKPDGRELLVVVVKGTFAIPTSGEEPQLAGEQAPLVMADEFTGEPGFSAPRYESDFAPFKPRCDVLFNGSAYAPNGEPTRKVRVTLRVGSMKKSCQVVGNRYWKRWLFLIFKTRPARFTVMPISYDNAYGGADLTNPKRQRYFPTNHAGKGFHHNLARKAIHLKPLPNTEEIGKPVRRPRGMYRPMAFGPVGRAWKPRPKFAGTYDKNWLDNVFPFLPADFDELYNQAAPASQQIDYPQGGEGVELLNLTPDGRTSFRLPAVSVPVTFYLKDGEEKEVTAVNDTVIIEPDLRRFILVWRTALPLKKNMFEVAQAVVGRMPRAWYRARLMGKIWYPSLKELVDSRAAHSAEAGQGTEELETVEEEM